MSKWMWTLNIIHGSHLFVTELLLSIKGHICLSSTCFLCPVTACHTPLMGNCCNTGNYTVPFSCIQSELCAFLQICISSLVIHHSAPFSQRRKIKRKLKKSFFGLFNSCFQMLSIKMNRWEKLLIITDSSHHEAMWRIAAECWEGQNSMHRVCNYLATINIVSQSFTPFSAVLIKF